jgi:hypothetical protein
MKTRRPDETPRSIAAPRPRKALRAMQALLEP